MWYQLRVTAYDVMDLVHISVSVSGREDGALEIAPVLSFSTDVRGEGIADPREWVRDALVAALEAL